LPDGAAYKAGIREGDQVIQVDDTNAPTWETISIKEISSANRPIEVWVLRNGQRLHFSLTPALDDKQGIGFAGWMQETEVQVSGRHRRAAHVAQIARGADSYRPAFRTGSSRRRCHLLRLNGGRKP